MGEPMPTRYDDLSQHDREAIWETLNAGSYYLFLGSGVSLDSTGMHGTMLSGTGLSKRLQGITGLSQSSTLQQNYRLLKPDQIQEHLTDGYNCQIFGETIGKLASTSWRRVYTLNIDNCFESSARIEIAKNRLPNNILSVYNFDDLYSDPSPSEVHSIVHLHGFVEKSHSGYIFSHNEYAREMTRQNSWMATLTQLMKAEPFIIAGTSLEEIDVEFYLQQHEGRSSAEPSRTHSVLIEPFPNPLTERACEDHNLVLFEGTVLDFYKRMVADFSEINNAYREYVPAKSLLPNLDPRSQILFESSFEAIPKTAGISKQPNRFLLGAPVTWEMLAADADIPRQAVSTIERDIDRILKSPEIGRIYLSDTGSGKSSLLKRTAFRLAKRFQNVFFFTGLELISEEEAASIINKISGDVIIFFDNIADCISYFTGVINAIEKNNVAFIGIERIYRRPYISDALSEFDIDLQDLPLGITRAESVKLLEKNEKFGLSDISQKRDIDIRRTLALVLNESIAIANCRIQNNFISFDARIKELLTLTSEAELKLFVLAALARHSFSGGVSKAVLHSIPDRANFAEIDNVYSKLPVVMAPSSPGYIIPASTSVSERVLEVLKKSRPELLLECLVQLAANLAPRVNRNTIRARTPESKLSGGLLDFDRTVQKFCDDLAESFYSEIEDYWSWNSRYWEQLSLLKLNRFLEDQSDIFLLQEAIQHARYAYSIEEHPLSLTTLAKALFTALETQHGDRDTIFAEGWSLIFHAIEIEKRWTRVKPTAFIVAFKGAILFSDAGGQFNGDQAGEIREALSIIKTRKLNDRKLNELREKVKTFVDKG